ncbi:MAG: hypothetical protein KGP14_06895 [Betaproteobacteria bacterium]|nr:hypothetical protein [Betaproteobacteria bacterium]
MSMSTTVFDDLRNAYEIADDEDFGKFNVDNPTNGLRVSWYYKQDAEYAKEWREKSARDLAPYSGILALAPGKNTGHEGDIEDFVVVVDRYPTEKCWPETDWVTLARLLSNKDLVEVFAK